jgi:hypothetical protein
MEQECISKSTSLLSPVEDDNNDSIQFAECQLCYADKDTHGKCNSSLNIDYLITLLLLPFIVIRPCNHRLCGSCAVRLQGSSTFCPWDRDKYTFIHSLIDKNTVSSAISSSTV